MQALDRKQETMNKQMECESAWAEVTAIKSAFRQELEACQSVYQERDTRFCRQIRYYKHLLTQHNVAFKTYEELEAEAEKLDPNEAW